MNIKEIEQQVQQMDADLQTSNFKPSRKVRVILEDGTMYYIPSAFLKPLQGGYMAIFGEHIEPIIFHLDECESCEELQELYGEAFDYFLNWNNKDGDNPIPEGCV